MGVHITGTENLPVQDVIKDFCSTDTLPDKFHFVRSKKCSVLSKCSRCTCRITSGVSKIESLSTFETKKEDLEAAKVVVEEKDKKILGTGLSNINKISLVNVLRADEQ